MSLSSAFSALLAKRGQSYYAEFEAYLTLLNAMVSESGLYFVGSSTTQLTVTDSTVTATIAEAGRSWAPGALHLFASAADPTNWMLVRCTSYSGTSYTGTVIDYGGSDTHADWSISPAAILFTVATAALDMADNLLKQAIIQDYAEAKAAPTISSGTLTLDLETANVFEVALNANVTTLTISNPAASTYACSFTLIFTADGTARSVSWPASMKWAEGSAPSLTSTNGKKDVFSFVTTDGGTSWLGFFAGRNF